MASLNPILVICLWKIFSVYLCQYVFHLNKVQFTVDGPSCKQSININWSLLSIAGRALEVLGVDDAQVHTGGCVPWPEDHGFVEN